LELDAMSPADAVFSHCRFVWLSQTNVPVVLLDHGINRTASLSNVNLTTLARSLSQNWPQLSSPLFDAVPACVSRRQ
jgi:hypothetical protein